MSKGGVIGYENQEWKPLLGRRLPLSDALLDFLELTLDGVVIARARGGRTI